MEVKNSKLTIKIKITLDIVSGDLIRQIWIGFFDCIRDFTVAIIARGNEKPFSARFGHFRGSDVREGKIADISPEEHSGRGEGGLVFALDNVADTLVGSVDSGQTGDMVGYGTVHHWGVDLRVNIELTEGIRDKKD